MTLRVFGRSVENAFDLLGNSENAMTAALGFCLDRAPRFRSAFIAAIGGPAAVAETTISLQTGRLSHGITDIEIRVGDAFFAVVEAKQGAWLPTVNQLTRYTGVLASSGAASTAMVTLSDVTVAFAEGALPDRLDGFAVRHLTWRRVLGLAAASVQAETQASRRVLRDLDAFLGPLIGMDSLFSNRVYVVSLGSGGPDGWPISWLDVVAKHNRYFYPVGKGWPPPPNYIGVRYKGQLQSIHHVDAYDVFTNPSLPFPQVPSAVWQQHYILTLGPPIRPARKVANGPRIHMSNRCWCMLDTLLTAETVSDALTETEARIARWNRERAV